jgi:hypothetical protein
MVKSHHTKIAPAAKGANFLNVCNASLSLGKIEVLGVK